jgi:hypothetical protein
MAKAASGQELSPQEQQELRIRDKAAAVEQFFNACGIVFLESQENDPRASLEASLDILLRIIESEDEEALFGAKGTFDGRDLVGKSFTVTSAPVARRSTFKGGLGWYLQFEADVLDPGTGALDRRLVSCGAANVMTSMAKLHRQGKLVGMPGLTLEESEETASGFKALWLKRSKGAEAVAEAGEDSPF